MRSPLIRLTLLVAGLMCLRCGAAPGADAQGSANSKSSSATLGSNAVTLTGPIESQGNNALCLDVDWANQANGTHVQVARCSGDAAQNWTFNGSTLTVFGNKCLDVTNGTNTDGTAVQIWDCTEGDTNQQWTQQGNQLQWAGTNKCLDTTGGALADGVQAVITTCANSGSQTWNFGASGTAAPNPMPAPAPTNPAPTGGAPSPAPAPTTGTGVPAGDSTGSTVGPGANAQLQQFSAAISAASAATGVPADLLAGDIWQESRAVASVGLMQITPEAFAQERTAHPNIGADMNDPATNILAGAYFMVEMQAAMQQKFNRSDWPIVLRAYNSGPNGVDPANLNALPAGTGDATYVTKVMNFWNIVSTGGTLPP